MPRSNILAGLLLLAALVFSCVRGLTPGLDTNSAPEAGKAPGGAQLSAPPVRLPITRSSALFAQQTAEQLALVDAPGRDLISITQRLRLHISAPIASIVNNVPPNYAVDTRHQFYIADLMNKHYYTATATIREVTAHAYWYVKDGYGVDLQALKLAARHFEEHIYLTDRRVFGSEPSPGIDNDPHITILLAPVAGVNGYFSSSDAYPRVVNPFSNQRKMIYISSQPGNDAGDPDNSFEATLAHEFQHMIHWNVHRDRDVWLDEGCSEIAMYLNGYSPGNFDYLFMAQPDVQLNAWESEPRLSRVHYGASYLFLKYLMDHYGGERFISSLVKQNGLGTSAINSAVKGAGNPAGFEGAFKDWVVADVMNNPSVANGRYSFADGGRAQLSKVFISYPAARTDTVHEYAADYIKLSGNLGAATITFKGSPTNRVIAADPHSGQAYWYSNRRDTGDAMLTRDLDLSHTSRATLQFWTWYDIEDTFDYAYIEASDDGGRTWTALKGKYTTTSNPNGANFGNGWTGLSGVSSGSSSAAARWVQESVDLRAYAGKKIEIRFEYITDEGYNGPGMAIDDLRVPEIGYRDDAESANGWNAAGFIRIGSTLPQRWYVALIENGAATRVREMQVDAAGVGTISLDGFGTGKSVRDATLVIAALAPKTTEPASYTVSVRKK